MKPIHCNEVLSKMIMYLYNTNIIYLRCKRCGYSEVVCAVCGKAIKNKGSYTLVNHVFEHHFELGHENGYGGSNYLVNKNGDVISLLTKQLFELIPYLLWLRPATPYPIMLNHMFCTNIVSVGGNRKSESGNELLELLKINTWICVFCELEFDSLPDYLLYKKHASKCTGTKYYS